jgi:pimeloyl-ACP methyl ester carboxylesterase
MNLPLRNSRIRLPLGQVFWREVGRGPALVFLHGSWHDGSQWVSVVEQLSQNYHCFALDLLGFGESERPKIHYSVQLEVECLFQYLEALHLSEVYLVGHSLGGWLAASYAIKHMERVNGLVLIAPEGVVTPGQRVGGGWTRWLIGHPPIAYLIVQAIYPLARLFGRHKNIEQALKWRKQILRSPAACKLLFRRRRAEIQSELLQNQLEWLTVPVLILQGASDSQDAIARSQTYANGSPNARLLMVEQEGHDLPESLPDLVAAQIHEFVNSVESRKVGNWKAET